MLSVRRTPCVAAAVQWAREHDAEAQRIAREGARRMRELSSTHAMAFYQMQVFEYYAVAYRRGMATPYNGGVDEWPLPGKKGNRSFANITSTARYHCEVRAPGAPRTPSECHFALPAQGDTSQSACGARLHCKLTCLRTNLSRCAMVGIADITSRDGFHHTLVPGC